MYCTQQIRSHCSPTIYAEQNEEVTVISQALHVAIVEGRRGRFPVLVELLSDEKVVVVVEAEIKPYKEQLELW